MKILFVHQNFPGQFKHLAPSLAAQGHAVAALGINKPEHPTPGVKVLLHRPRVNNPESIKEAPLELRELHAKRRVATASLASWSNSGMRALFPT